MAKDLFHHNARQSLEKEGWEISADPLRIYISKKDYLEIDLAAENIFLAKKGQKKIEVEVKSFIRKSFISAFHEAMGQYLDYKSALADNEPDRIIYLAIPEDPFYNELFQGDFIQKRLKEESINLIVFNISKNETIKLLKYQNIIKEVLTNYTKQGATDPNAREHLETQLFFDDERGHYQVLRIGWEGVHGLFLVIFHFDIKDSKIWVQRNISDYDIIGDLEEKGVPKSDIVLAFLSPRMRPYTEYAPA